MVKKKKKNHNWITNRVIFQGEYSRSHFHLQALVWTHQSEDEAFSNPKKLSPPNAPKFRCPSDRISLRRVIPANPESRLAVSHISYISLAKKITKKKKTARRQQKLISIPGLETLCGDHKMGMLWSSTPQQCS